MKQSPRNQRPRAPTAKQKKLIKYLAKHPEASHQELIKHSGYGSGPAISAALYNSKGVKNYWAQVMSKHPELTDNALAKKIAQGTKSKLTKFFAHEGRVTETRIVEDTHLQKEYVELALKLNGALTNKMELTGEDGTPLTINLVHYAPQHTQPHANP